MQDKNKERQKAQCLKPGLRVLANVCIIVSICPMFTAIIAQIFLKEKNINFLFVVGFLVAISGFVFVTFNGELVFHLSPKGDFLALAAAVC